MFPHITTHTLLIKRMNKLYTHNYTTQRHLYNRGLFRDIRTNRKCSGLMFGGVLGEEFIKQEHSHIDTNKLNTDMNDKSFNNKRKLFTIINLPMKEIYEEIAKR